MTTLDTPLPEPITLYKSSAGPERYLSISVEQRSDTPLKASIVLNLRPSRDAQPSGRHFGPYVIANGELSAQRELLISEALKQGYERSGVSNLRAELQSPLPKLRARAARRIARLRFRELQPELIALLDQASDDACSIIEALGEIGDARAILALRPLASWKLLSRRRAAWEALRRLGDQEGLAALREEAVARLPDPISSLYRAANPEDLTQRPLLREALAKLDKKFLGLAADGLYEIGEPLALALTEDLLDGALQLQSPFHWRYIKSIYKRAEVRRDPKVLAQLILKLEKSGSGGPRPYAKVKSGYDGSERSMPIAHPRTRAYLLRRSLRRLRVLTEIDPLAYVNIAAEVLAATDHSALAAPKAHIGALPKSHHLKAILLGRSKRWRLEPSKLRAYKIKAFEDDLIPNLAAQELTAPQAWAAFPAAWLRVLASARLPQIRASAFAIAQSQLPSLLPLASAEQLIGLLSSEINGLREASLHELSRRLHEDSITDWDLIARLAATDLPSAQERISQWLINAAPSWTRSPPLTELLLSLPPSPFRDQALQISLAALAGDGPDDLTRRDSLAHRILPGLLRGDAPALLVLAASGLAAELDSMLSDEQLIALLGGSIEQQGLAGAVLSRRPQFLDILGLQRVTDLARHEQSFVRAAACKLLRGALSSLRLDPSPLIALIDSDWPDTREAASNMLLGEIDIARLGFEGIFALIDSTRPEVQNFGLDLLLQNLNEFEPLTVMARLAEHPHANVRRRALELIDRIGSLSRAPLPAAVLAPMIRAAFFDLKPSRAVKARLLKALGERVDACASQVYSDRPDHELRSAEARDLAAILDELVPTIVERDAEAILSLALRLLESWPELEFRTLKLCPAAQPEAS
jgi:hypothetical protein